MHTPTSRPLTTHGRAHQAARPLAGSWGRTLLRDAKVDAGGRSPWENGYVESFNGRLHDEMLDLASGGEKPPIICDESLVQYDDGRALTCLKYLHELGSEYQILLLTCHDRERKVALELGANVIPL